MAHASINLRAALWAVTAALLTLKVAKLCIGAKTSVPLMNYVTSGLRTRLLGHIVEAFDQSLGIAYLRWFPNTDRAVHLRYATSDVYMTANAEDINFVLTTGLRSFPKGPLVKMMKRVLGDGLFSQLDEDVAALHRKELAQAFSPASLAFIANRVVPQHARHLLETIDAHIATSSSSTDGPKNGTTIRRTAVEIQPVMKSVAMGIVADASFRSESPEETQYLVDHFNAAWKAFFTMARLLKPIDVGMVFQNWKVANLLSDIRSRVARMQRAILEHHHQQLGGSEEDGTMRSPTEMSENDSFASRKALIDYLVLSENIPSSTVMEHCLTFIFAGYDTTSSALTFLIYLLAKHPECQEKLYEELCGVVGSKAVCSVDDVRSAVYLRSVVMEALRLYPPAVVLQRQVLQDEVLPGTKTFVPKGSNVSLCLYAMQRDKTVFGLNSHDFYPERWEEADAERLAMMEAHFLPFSTGRRHCIGKDFAMKELLLLTAVMARNYKLELPKEQQEPYIVMRPLLEPRDPLKIQFSPR